MRAPKSFLGLEHSRGDTRDHAARREPLAFDAQRVLEARDDAALAGGQGTQADASHFFRCFCATKRVFRLTRDFTKLDRKSVV